MDKTCSLMAKDQIRSAQLRGPIKIKHYNDWKKRVSPLYITKLEHTIIQIHPTAHRNPIPTTRAVLTLTTL